MSNLFLSEEIRQYVEGNCAFPQSLKKGDLRLSDIQVKKLVAIEKSSIDLGDLSIIEALNKDSHLEETMSSIVNKGLDYLSVSELIVAAAFTTSSKSFPESSPLHRISLLNGTSELVKEVYQRLSFLKEEKKRKLISMEFAKACAKLGIQV